MHLHSPSASSVEDMTVNGHHSLSAILSELPYDQWMLICTSGRRPLTRYKHAAAVVHEKLFVIGGSHNGRYLSDVQVLDLRSLSWSVLNLRVDTGTLSAQKTSSNEVFPAISSHSLVAWENKLLVIAGHSKEKSDAVTVWSIDPETLLFSVIKTQGKVPIARSGQSVTLMGSKLIMFGGEDGRRKLLNDLHVLDLSTMSWDVVETKKTPPSPRFDHSATVHAGQYFFIFGGSSPSSCFGDLHVLDLQSLEWSQPDVQGVGVASRGGHAGATVGDMWYMVGGGNTTSGATETIALCMPKLVWSIATKVSRQDPLASEGLTLCSLSMDGESVLIAFGGYNGKYSNELFVLKPKPRTPAQPKLYQSPAAAAAAASVTAAYAVATLTDRKNCDSADEYVKEEPSTNPPEATSLDAENLAAKKNTLECKLAELREENEKVKLNLEDVRNQQSLLAMELKAVRSQLEGERSRCFKLEAQLLETAKRLEALGSIERELEILRQQRSEREQDIASVQREASGGLLRWMTG
ncbi:Acyl-CoA-binding domain-containing protein 4 [Apostasia shenzhenica]|uniref:Acyl-CoA-binding domain-containing protein 4 n=1 Tax=Apostasia shenzhenica TaxID=1088818 RepID=A0A2I0AV59_9ASPA|nr:Acyl-CoA-binding domain-containing protein 4 [Apostasia shenzhenica]